MKKTARLAAILPAGLLLIVFWALSFYGLDYGAHWDEDRSKFDSVKKSIDTGLFLQSVDDPEGRGYTYGGVNYLLTWAGLTPEIASYLANGPRTQEAFAKTFAPIIYSRAVRLRVRAIYVVLSSLSILWVYCLVLLCDRSRLEAFLAAAILSLSWEVGYHSRWTAPDAVMMQFAALAFLCLAAGAVRKSARWLDFGAVVVGLTVGTKYPGGAVLPFFLVGAGYLDWRGGQPLSRGLPCCMGRIGIAGLTFLITTPGIAIDPFHFFSMLHQLKDFYARDLQGGYSVSPGLHHFGAILSYFGLQAFSHYRPLSIVLTVFCILGLLSLVAERRRVELLFAAFCVAYLVYFSQQAVMYVRNFLVVFPLLALAAARGVTAVSQHSSDVASYKSVVLAAARGVTAVSQRLHSWGKLPVYGMVAAILAVNLGWACHAAEQIRNRNNAEYFLGKFDAYVRNAPRDVFFVSAQLRGDLAGLNLGRSGNIVADDREPFTKAAFFQTESAEKFSTQWPSNRWNLYDRTFGSLEVNLNAYSTFIGNERILVVDRKQLAALPLMLRDLTTDTGTYTLTLDKAEVVAGKDSYSITVPGMANANVLFRYTVDNSEPREFTSILDDRGNIRFDVPADVPKGFYRFTAFRLAWGWHWYDTDATLRVK